MVRSFLERQSKKLWATILGVVTLILREHLGLSDAASIEIAAVLGVYVASQGWVDASRARGALPIK